MSDVHKLSIIRVICIRYHRIAINNLTATGHELSASKTETCSPNKLQKNTTNRTVVQALGRHKKAIVKGQNHSQDNLKEEKLVAHEVILVLLLLAVESATPSLMRYHQAYRYCTPQENCAETYICSQYHGTRKQVSS